MTVNEAEKRLMIDTTVKKITRVSESNNYFIFNVVPIDHDDDSALIISPPTAVEKKTGRKITFNPMVFDKDELKSIKRIR